MNYRKYGKLGWDVSALGMGCMRFPRLIHDDGRVEVDLEKTFEMIRRACDSGINYFDTALTYHNNHSEAILGEALETLKMRDKVFIATKQPFGHMKTQDDIRQNLERTLKKLRTDHIDVYLLHGAQNGWEEAKRRNVLREFEKFKSEGLIRAIGFSCHCDFEMFSEIIGYFDWDMCQVQQNIVDTARQTTEKSIGLAGKQGAAVVIMEPLKGGGLANAPDGVRSVYDGYPVRRSPAEWAFRHLLDYHEVSVILSGMTTMEQLNENIDIFGRSDAVPGCLSDGEKGVIAVARDAYESIVSIPCTGCEYCQPCPNRVQINRVFDNYNDGMRFREFGQPRRAYYFMEQWGTGAASCADCGECVPKCPQNIDIPASLKTAHAALTGWKE